ncbi:MAG: hypothetical protein ACE5FC_07660, partial [Myxococcota bacterium]
ALTWGESAYLAAMLPNPHRYNTAVQPGALRKRQQRLVARLIREGRIPEDRHAEAISARPPHP